MDDGVTDADVVVKLAGAAVLLLGASFAGFGLWSEEFSITVAGGFTGVAGLGLLGLSPRVGE